MGGGLLGGGLLRREPSFEWFEGEAVAMFLESPTWTRSCTMKPQPLLFLVYSDILSHSVGFLNGDCPLVGSSLLEGPARMDTSQES